MQEEQGNSTNGNQRNGLRKDGPTDSVGAADHLKATMRSFSELTKEQKDKVIQEETPVENQIVLAPKQEVVIDEKELKMLPMQIQHELVKLEQKKIQVSSEMVDSIDQLVQEALKKANDASLFSIAQAIGIIADKIQLLSGGATIRVESRGEHKILSKTEKGDLYDHLLGGGDGGKKP